MRLRGATFFGMAMLLCASLTARADVPTEMNVQGRFTDSTGAPRADTTLDVRFAIYDQQILGSQVWPPLGALEMHNIQTDAQGLWNARIGSIIPLTEAAFTDTSRWLQVVVNTDAGLIDLPRVILNTSPFAFNAVMSQHADTANYVIGGISGPYLPLIGGMMTGAITSSGNPSITMGKGNFGVGNTNSGLNAFVAGEGNVADGDHSTVGGGLQDSASGAWATVAGGYLNWATGEFSSVGGGWVNAARGVSARIGGGSSNFASGSYATIPGGLANTASDSLATISGGRLNAAANIAATVGGGLANLADSAFATISGGTLNRAHGRGVSIGGGAHNHASGAFAVIGGGGGDADADSNSASGNWSTVGGGTWNHAKDIYTTISGGQFNTANNWNATVGGGYFNVADGLMASVGGGSSNSAIGDYASVAGGVANDARTFATTVAGGNDNDATASAATIGGGQYNKAASYYATIAGGLSNHADSVYSAVGGGTLNRAGGHGASVGGGGGNQARGKWSTIAGGGGDLETDSNSASGAWATIGGGSANYATADHATVAGGISNHVYSLRSTIGGGSGNVISSGEGAVIAGGALNSASSDGATIGGGVNGASIGHYSTLGGGYNNISSGISSTVPGGEENEATGDNSFAAGFRAKATHAGSFVWSDHTAADFNSLYDDEFAIRATNGIRTKTNSTSYGAYFNNDGNGDGVRTYGYSSQGNNWAALYAYNTGTSPAVYGYSSGGPAAYFAGNVTVTGTLTKGGGAFKIDHPLDPQNKYLLHSFVESPDMKNVYDGVVLLDANGEAWVTLPDWFDALNRDFRYQLTCVGGYAPVYIADEIAGNRFRIAGGKAGLKVSWQVTGIRQDAYANAHRIPVEEDKAPDERGKYLHPEALGFSSASGISVNKDKTPPAQQQH